MCSWLSMSEGRKIKQRFVNRMKKKGELIFRTLLTSVYDFQGETKKLNCLRRKNIYVFLKGFLAMSAPLNFHKRLPGLAKKDVIDNCWLIRISISWSPFHFILMNQSGG